ncbi:GNAT family N-acetyltransferase [Brevibacillus invocatus]
MWAESETIPVHQTLTASKNGGFLLGAFLKGQLIGFQYSFPGYDGKSIYLCSHNLAVDPHFRRYGVGEKLKLAQWEQGKKMGYSFISWTYDPLESVNGYLNIGKLGADCSTYIENCYGEMEDHLNDGLPSDRFLVKWTNLKNKSSLKDQITKRQREEVNIVTWKTREDGIPVIEELAQLQEGYQGDIAVAIPAHFQRVKELAPAIALDWRLRTRELFTHLFNIGWEVTDFVRNQSFDAPVHFYILKRIEGTT